MIFLTEWNAHGVELQDFQLKHVSVKVHFPTEDFACVYCYLSAPIAA